jgi:hypothetical protein
MLIGLIDIGPYAFTETIAGAIDRNNISTIPKTFNILSYSSYLESLLGLFTTKSTIGGYLITFFKKVSVFKFAASQLTMLPHPVGTERVQQLSEVEVK